MGNPEKGAASSEETCPGSGGGRPLGRGKGIPEEEKHGAGGVFRKNQKNVKNRQLFPRSFGGERHFPKRQKEKCEKYAFPIEKIWISLYNGVHKH